MLKLFPLVVASVIGGAQPQTQAVAPERCTCPPRPVVTSVTPRGWHPAPRPLVLRLNEDRTVIIRGKVEITVRRR